MAQTMAESSDLPRERIKALRRVWALGTFNGAAYGFETIAGCGTLEWVTDGEEIRLVYHAPYGLACHLGRIYRQPNNTWAAVVVAGVKDDQFEAMATVEWAISRLTAEDARRAACTSYSPVCSVRN
jgi:hypothetical protein